MMNRLWLLLLLLVVHAPAPAVAGTPAYVQQPGQDRITLAAPALDSGALRPTPGLELVQDLGARLLGGERSRSDVLDLPPRPGEASHPAPVLRRGSAATLARVGAPFPRFEHLPYLPTAPPLPR